ncbi:MAG: hypothetical protein VYC39_12615 [Myxococcota bacterium]|nr:hypothetical protein [Myxococcota bacterium]
MTIISKSLPKQINISSVSRAIESARLQHIEETSKESKHNGYGRLGAARARSAASRVRHTVETTELRVRDNTRQVERALKNVKEKLRPFRRENAAPTPGEKLSQNRAKVWSQRTKGFAKAMDGFEKSRRSLLENRSSAQIDKWKAAYGANNTETQIWSKLSSPQMKALEVFLRRFSTPKGLGLEQGTLAAGVAPASDQVLMALAGAIRTSFSSIDAQGAPNIDHLATVYRGVLEDQAKSRGRSLVQGEVDKLVFETVCTDIWMKGQSVDVLANTKIAQTDAGATGGDIYRHMKQQILGKFSDASPATKQCIEAWVTQSFVPMDPQGVADTAARFDLTPAETKELKAIWGSKIMASGDFLNLQGFMLGVWLHGLPSFETVKNAVDSAGKGLNSAQEVYFAVLGHHMAGFIAAGFARGQVRVDFAEMEKRGELPAGAANKLEDLYISATSLAAKWRAIIDKEGVLSTAQREEYRADAKSLRSATAALPEAVRTQLLNDDEMQFTPLGLEKWLNMTKGATQGEIVENLYRGPVQAYYEEQIARDLAPEPGSRFVRKSQPAMDKLGVTLDLKTSGFRLAKETEPEFQRHAEAILADSSFRREFEKDTGISTDSATFASNLVVEWFRSRPSNKTDLVRLVQQ